MTFSLAEHTKIDVGWGPLDPTGELTALPQIP